MRKKKRKTWKTARGGSDGKALGRKREVGETLGQRRTGRSSLQVEVMKKVPELVVHERLSQGRVRKEESERMVY